MIFPLTSEDKGRLQRLSKDQPLIFSLKKLFLNEMEKGSEDNVQVLAAERMGQKYIAKAFHSLSVIHADNPHGEQNKNMI